MPVTEQKDSIGYSDNSSSLSAQIEKKAPTSKQLQELKETMNSADGDESDDNLLFNLSSVSRSSGAMLDSLLGSATDSDCAVPHQPQVQQGNRKGRRGAGGGSGCCKGGSNWSYRAKPDLGGCEVQEEFCQGPLILATPLH